MDGGAFGRVVLALDLASTVGYACGSGDLKAHCLCGSFRLPDDVSAGRQYGAFSNWLADTITTYEPTDLVIEAPFIRVTGDSLRAVRKLFGLASIAELIAYRRDLRFREHAAPSVRKTFCGSGRADKKQVVAECERRGFTPRDHNAADALALLFHALEAA